MLHKDEAQRRLKEYLLPDWRKRRLKSIARFPSHLKLVFTNWFQERPVFAAPTPDKKLDDAYRQGFAWLDTTSPSKRKKIFKALFPKISEYVEAGWNLLSRLPFQRGWLRKAFRSPNDPATTLPAKIQWLLSLLPILEGYEEDIQWLATWAAYLKWGAGDALGILFAAAIDMEDENSDKVYEILVDSAKGEHEIGAMGKHVIRSLLISSREDGWDFIESLLRAAQRQEGLRQSILEAVDESHPQAFRRMLQQILDENLIRFSSVVRAADVWFGLELDVRDKALIQRYLRQTLDYVSSIERPIQRTEDEDGMTTYLRLWAMAFDDTETVIEPASELLNDERVDHRFAALHLLAQLNLQKSHSVILDALDDTDLTVATRALLAFNDFRMGNAFGSEDLFERIERNMERFPKKKRILNPTVFPWMKLSSERSAAAGALIYCLGARSPKRLVPYLKIMKAPDRARVADLLVKSGRWDTDMHEVFMQLLGDASARVREHAIREIGRRKITSRDVEKIEALLTRKPSDLRRGILSILINQKDADALASADRLLATGNTLQRLAGLEILRTMVEKDRQSKSALQKVKKFAAEAKDLSNDEEILIEQISMEDRQPATLEDGLGLFAPAERTPPTPPRSKKQLPTLRDRKELVSKAAVNCLFSLDDLIHQHRAEQVVVDTPMGKQEELLGNLRWLTLLYLGRLKDQDQETFPLEDLLEEWWAGRDTNLRDADQLELLQAFAALLDLSGVYSYRQQDPGWIKPYKRKIYGDTRVEELKYPGILRGFLEWLIHEHPPENATDYLLDSVEYTFSLIPKSELAFAPDLKDFYSIDWRGRSDLLGWLQLCRIYRTLCPDAWSDNHHIRLWGLLRWMDEPGTKVARHRPNIEDLLYAFQAGGATEADVIEQLIGPRAKSRYGISTFHDLSMLSRRTPPKHVVESPDILEIVDRCRKRVVEVELGRGDIPTEASGPALSLRWSGGGDVLIGTLKALGKAKLVRGWIYDNKSKTSVLSHLLRVSYPKPEDTIERMHEALSDSGISQNRLIEAAVYSPQWAQHVERAIGWDGFTEGVWWIHAHTKDNRWRVGPEIREAWVAEINTRTSLAADDLIDGAVDVAWFHQIYETLGSERWEALYKASIYSSGGGGHNRAKLFADAMLARKSQDEIRGRIESKRHQDSVRALGLVPLPTGDEADKELLARYQLFQEFLRTSRKFGSQRQASEKLAVRIGMENLARTAGYPDPARLQWAMEASEIADLATGPVVYEADDVVLNLSINHLGEPELKVLRNDKRLKSVPSMIRKDPQVVEIRQRKTNINRQASRMRYSLENAMCRGDIFEKGELQELLKHPVLAPMISQVIFISEAGNGYLVEGGERLEGLDEKVLVAGDVGYVIAHPYDLLQSKRWHDWQRECFLRERIQPFKQVFRELYVLTSQEKKDGERSLRYAGHQVNPRQALALLGQRGWVSHPEVGPQRTFHKERITAHVSTQGGFLTPQEVEGLTIEGVAFIKRGEWIPVQLTEVPPRVFSEAMRDLDLVVSVAHMGGVDPEASASTVEMRSSLVNETCSLLHIENVEVKGAHALIEGTLGSYSVHMGSAIVHKQPGGAVCMVPVHQQHRGRLFLPFVDDDPRTAEVISKVLLLAKDSEIKDPTILEQLIH